MSEWFKEHDWKSCVRLKRTGGSNPLLCATITHPKEGAFFRGAEKSLRSFRIIGGSRERRPNTEKGSVRTVVGGATLCCKATKSCHDNAPQRGCVLSWRREEHEELYELSVLVIAYGGALDQLQEPRKLTLASSNAEVGRYVRPLFFDEDKGKDKII